ncbi:MAG: xanthine dehydrogenase family protein molybdopterin-binding subunit [Chloroflexaceae bacterium]|nr:xanthine dehydrogenase family protein molybdopterin-binding subunit [Chloroflexaceae bacterium]NJO07073.1 xanthine dehydrogenase family protein molybdopterin-binding subunit [Chloroflexaceae bacterium]
MLMALGSTLFEEIVFDQGQVANPNWSEYMVPSILDMPAGMSHSLVGEPTNDIPGVGETALPVVPPAIGNAVANALVVRIYDLPLMPEKILCAIVGEHQSLLS